MQRRRTEGFLDPLLGIGVRREAWWWLEYWGKRSEREGVPLTVVMLDLDDFKEINDRFGHAEGDAVLQAWGQFLRERIPDDARAFRYGGDEVLILFPGWERQDVVALAHRWLQEARQFGFHGYPVGMSAGIASYPLDTPKWVELVALADAALLEAKARGKFTLATPKEERPKFRWPVPFVPRPSESRDLLEAFRSASVLLVVGDTGVGKSRLIQETLLRIHRGVIQNRWDTHAKGIWLTQDHHTPQVLRHVFSIMRSSGGKVILETRPDGLNTLVQMGFHQLWQQGWIREVWIPPLTEAQTHVLVRRTLGSWAPEKFSSAVFQATGGIPAYVGALLKALLRESWIYPRGRSYRILGIPRRLRIPDLEPYWEEVVRFWSLSARKAVGILGLAGNPLPFSLWESLVRMLVPSADPIEILEEVQTFVAENGGWVHWRQPLFARFAEDLLTHGERSLVAREVLEHNLNLEEETRLYLMGLVSLDRAVDEARRLVDEGLHTLNAQKIQKVLDWCRVVGMAFPWTEIARGWVAFMQGESREAREILERYPMEDLPPFYRYVRIASGFDAGCMDRVEDELHEWERLCTGEECLDVAIARAWQCLIKGQNREAFHRFRKISRKTRSLSLYSRARVAYGLGQAAMFLGKFRAARRYLSDVLTLLSSNTADYPRAQGVILVVLAHLEHRRGFLKRAESLVRKGLSRAWHTGSADVEAYGWSELGEILLDQGFLSHAQGQFEKTVALCSATGLNRFLMPAYEGLARWALYRGDVKLAESYLARERTIAQTYGDENVETPLAVWIAWEKGDWEPFHRYVENLKAFSWKNLEPVLYLGTEAIWMTLLNRMPGRLADQRAAFLRDLWEAWRYAQNRDRERVRQRIRQASRRLRYFGSPLFRAIYDGFRTSLWRMEEKTSRADRAAQRVKRVGETLHLTHLLAWFHRWEAWGKKSKEGQDGA